MRLAQRTRGLAALAFLLATLSGGPAAAQFCDAGYFLCLDNSGCCPFGTICGDGFNGCSAFSCCAPSTTNPDPGPGSGHDPDEVEVCENTCSAAFDGVCQDQSPLTDDSPTSLIVCALGSDCADCGPRTLPRDEIGGCSHQHVGGDAGWLWLGLLLLAGVHGRRRLALLLAFGAFAVVPRAASAEPVLDLAPGVVFGGSASPSFGAAEIGPRLRLGVHWDLGDVLAGVHTSSHLSGQIGRLDDGEGPASQWVGGRAVLDLGAVGCLRQLGPDGVCATLAGFVAGAVQHRFERADGAVLELSYGPSVAAHFAPTFVGTGVLRGARFEVAWDVRYSRVEARLGFEL